MRFEEWKRMPKSVFSDRYRAFLAHVIRARKDVGITQSELSDRLKKPQSFVSKSETGERRMDFVELIEWLNALGSDPKDFIEYLLRDPSFEKNGKLPARR